MAGLIKVIAGEMFSGKSQELARLIAESANQGFRVQVFYPAMASRGSARDIERRIDPRLGISMQAVANADARVLEDLVLPSTQVVAVDEAQFFSDDIVDVVKVLRRRGKLVLIGGLDLDYLEHPFGRMGDLMCIANEVMKCHAFCAGCRKQDAFISHRLTGEAGQVAVGEHNYIPLCEDCYVAATHQQEVPQFVDSLND